MGAHGADCCLHFDILPQNCSPVTMPPKSPAKALTEVVASLVKPKAKAKGKGKGKAKVKGKAKAKSVPKVAEDATADTETAADEEGLGILPIDGSTEQPKAKAKPKLAILRRKVLEGLNGKSVQDGMAEAKQELAKVEAASQEASALEEVHAAQAATATKEFEEVHAAMKAAIEQEAEAGHP